MGEIYDEQSSPADSPEGFAGFYHLLFERQLPRHAMEDWVRPLYAAREESKGLVVEAFRGSSKTTTLSIAFAAFRLGLEPHKSTLIIQASNPAARTTCQQIADIIEYNEGWRKAFPKVEPDKKSRWSMSSGYELKRTHVDYDKWRAVCVREKGKDPSFIGYGYRAHSIIGRHPTGLLLVDDIHDENNTRSIRELDKALNILKGTILPTLTPSTWQIFVGTPWTPSDALQHLKATERFISVATPVYRDRDEGGGLREEDVPRPTSGVKDAGEGDAEHGTIDEKVPVWPERFPIEEIEKVRQLVGEAEFARMYLLDLTAAEGMNLKAEWLQDYPHEKIQPQWPVLMGVDYASAADARKGDRRDYFAVAVGRALPGGGIVLVDGYRAQISQGEAEEYVKLLAARYPTTVYIGVESVGKGEEFFHLLHRNSLLPLLEMHPAGKSKGDRFEKAMAPMFQWRHAFVADVVTPFLRAFREEWLRWPDGEHDDTLDAVAWMLQVGQAYLFSRTDKEKKPSPFAELGRS